MSGLKRLVLFVEGEGDRLAVPTLVNHLLEEQKAHDCLYLDGNIVKIGGVEKISGKAANEWIKKLGVAAKRGNLGGVLVILDGDLDRFEGQSFCAANAARELCKRAKGIGAGSTFSLAFVFACIEFESWLIASIDTLAGKPLAPDGRQGVRAGTVPPTSDLEKVPRDAKRWLSHNMHMGYKPTTDQHPLTQLLLQDLSHLRQKQLRSFVRFEKAIRDLVTAFRSQQNVISPC